VDIKKFLKSIGIGLIVGFIGWFFSASYEVASLLFVLVTYLELRRDKDDKK
jgi:uncharacterized membrane protein (Fun14 family)